MVISGDQFVGGTALPGDVEVHNFVSIVLHLENWALLLIIILIQTFIH